MQIKFSRRPEEIFKNVHGPLEEQQVVPGVQRLEPLKHDLYYKKNNIKPFHYYLGLLYFKTFITYCESTAP